MKLDRLRPTGLRDVPDAQADRGFAKRTPIFLAGAALLVGGIYLVTGNSTELDFASETTAVTPRLELGRRLQLSAARLDLIVLQGTLSAGGPPPHVTSVSP
jgi:hypothetical protein